ncbi:MAG: hypothetical protein HOV81_45690 [Kofleriaceae bacterium]|nr:hypothetical protein [Kofleriaceae bacterium]
MRALGLAIGLVVAACYSPSYRDCEITCASGACPSGYVCDLGVCRVEGFSGACGGNTADDRDGDGVADDRDNCPDTPNANQANEDMDAYGDVCDPCPISAEPNGDADPDGDGVGNACDPTPDTEGDSIALFEGFADPVLPAGAEAVPTTGWTFADGSAFGTSMGFNPAVLAWPVANEHQTIRAKITINRLDGSSFRGAGVATPVDASTNDGIMCWIVDSTYQVATPLTVTNPYAMVQTSPIEAGKQYEFTLSRANADMQCSDAILSAPLTATVPETQLTGTRAGVFVVSVDAKIDWILVVNQ